MYVLEILPLAAGLPEGTLTYRSREDYPAGTIVNVPLRKKEIRGVVVESMTVSEAKGTLKRASFALKSSGGAARTGTLPASIMKAARAVAAYHAASLGSTLFTLLADALPEIIPAKLVGGEAMATAHCEAPYQQRLAMYEAIIAEDARAKRATMLIVPTSVELARFARTFSVHKPVLVSGAVTGKKRAAAIAAALDASLVLATPAFAWLPIPKLGSIIIERASAGTYRTQKRPYLDLRMAAAELAHARNARVVYGDFPLPLELREKPAALLHGATITELAPAALIDNSGERIEGEVFRAVPEAMLKGIGKAISAGGRAAVLAVRKGYAPTVICRDCGKSVKDTEGRTLSFTTRGARSFRSSDGTLVEAAHTQCDNCGSWNLLPLGIGVERVAEEIREAIPDAHIVMLDTDAVRTPSAAKKAALAISEPGTVIVGTEFMLPFLDARERLEYAAIASADSLLALPFWRASERLVHAGLTLRDRAKRFAIATRRPEDPAIQAVINPAESEFFSQETAMRKALRYPPFGHLIVFHAEASSAKAEEAASMIADAIKPLTGTRLSNRPAGTRVRISIIAKVDAEHWPDPAIVERTSALPPWISRAIDTESLW